MSSVFTSTLWYFSLWSARRHKPDDTSLQYPPGGLIHGSHWLKQGLSLILKERERENEPAKELFIDVKLLTIYPIVLFGLE